MPQNKYSTFKREELGHSKKLSDQNKTETHQDTHQILQLHVRYLGLSHRLGRPSAFDACAHTASPGWFHSEPPAFSAAVHGSTPPILRFHFYFGLTLMYWLLRASLKSLQACHGFLGLSDSTKPWQKTSGSLSLLFFIPEVVDTAKFCC